MAAHQLIGFETERTRTPHPSAILPGVDKGAFAPAVLDHLPTALLVVDVTGVVVVANRRAGALFQRPSRTLVGCRTDAFCISLARIKLAAQPENEEVRSEATVVLPDGRTMLVGFSVSSFSGDDGNTYYSVAAQDITAFEKLREEHDRLLQIAAVGDVLPALLHELKNPLAAITTALEVTVEAAQPGELQDDLHTILGEARRLRLTLEGVGCIGRQLDAGQHAAIDHAAREAFRILAPQAHEKGISTHERIADLPLLPFDPCVIRAIAFNLVTNSIHACKRGAEITLEMGLSPGQAAVEMTVRDTGGGMSEAVLQRCRELFFSTKSNGSGVGLALCESTVAAAGGSMRVRSAPGIGTTITLSIPLPDHRRAVARSRRAGDLPRESQRRN